MRVHLVHWDVEEAQARVAQLTSLGHEAIFLPGVTGTPLMRALRAGAPDCFVIDLGRRPSHGREVATALAASPSTRLRPIVFAGGDTEAVARMRALAPGAVYSTWGRIGPALVRARRTGGPAPSVSASQPFAGRSLAQKLGIRAGERVGVVGAPAGFAALLGALPAGAHLTADPAAVADRFLWFVRSRRELDAALARLSALLGPQVAWLAWPKGRPRQAAGINGNVVREAGLLAGFVDFKVCSVNETWSGLAFKRRRR